MREGVVFDVEEFTVFDGPGLRQTVFLKGCPLRCSWCHNPEGLSGVPQLMVGTASCTGCGKCREVCRHKTCISCGEMHSGVSPASETDCRREDDIRGADLQDPKEQ